jgi:serine/threonine protein kinase
MATVWRARDEVLARPVAIKILHEHLAEDEEFLERFRREALAAARLTHPNIVAIYDSGHEVSADGIERHYIVMEYCGGGTLADVIARQGPLAPERVMAVGAAVCNALSYAHQIGVIHRDVKPANILLTGEGALKVGDFGIAKAAFRSKDITTTGSILGTVRYLSPEQARGLEPDHRSDLYALGVVLYELATGRPPFEAESAVATAMKHMNETPQTPRSLRAQIPRELDLTIMKSLNKDPAHRFESAADMAGTLMEAPASEVTTTFARPPDEGAPVAEGPSPTRAVLPVLLLVAAAVVAAIWLASVLSDRSPSRNNSPDTSNGGASGRLTIASAQDLDPYGDGEEHAEDVPLAYDGDTATAWETESYEDTLSLLGKRGLGLVFDLGESVQVAEVEVTGCTDCEIQILAGDSLEDTETAYEAVAESGSADDVQTFDVDDFTAQYWVVWITSLPGGGGGSATVSEVSFLGP